MSSTNVTLIDQLSGEHLKADVPARAGKVEVTTMGRVVQATSAPATVWDDETKTAVPHYPTSVPPSTVAMRIEAERAKRKRAMMSEYVKLLRSEKCNGNDLEKIEALAKELGRVDQIAADSTLINKIKHFEDQIKEMEEKPLPEGWENCHEILAAHRAETQRIILEREAEERRLDKIDTEASLAASLKRGWEKSIEIYRLDAPDLLADVPKRYTGFIDPYVHGRS